jgi:hypothetical protein
MHKSLQNPALIKTQPKAFVRYDGHQLREHFLTLLSFKFSFTHCISKKQILKQRDYKQDRA